MLTYLEKWLASSRYDSLLLRRWNWTTAYFCSTVYPRFRWSFFAASSPPSSAAPHTYVSLVYRYEIAMGDMGF
jgi:hypothetical protein